MRDDEILLDVHQLVHADRLEVVELLAQRVKCPVQELLDGVALLQLDLAPMTRPVPVAVGDGDLLRLDSFLLVLPLLTQLLPAHSESKPSLGHHCPSLSGEMPLGAKHCIMTQRLNTPFKFENALLPHYHDVD